MDSVFGYDDAILDAVALHDMVAAEVRFLFPFFASAIGNDLTPYAVSPLSFLAAIHDFPVAPRANVT